MSMFMDQYVLAGLAVVAMTIGFLVAFGTFVWKDAHKKKSGQP
ncbi:cytochrome c oxidase subunit CcoM [Allohahella marinimesophila]|uniref:DUF3149 domain-containing protein n=1 Tax=Allohahella marinimesophila TaxID=1054972 RepID=A0ABP7PX15_9GAMM